MNHWLLEFYDGRSVGTHHQAEVPEELRDYLIFTLARNPYDLWVSYAFHVAWGDQAPKQEELGSIKDEKERRRKFRQILEMREKEQREVPSRSDVSLSDRIEQAKRDSHDGRLQKDFLDRAGVNLVLYFEKLPNCLNELPFVNPSDIPHFPHHPERGIRPPSSFFDVFDPEEEEVVWAAASQDFATLHYERHQFELPENAPSTLWIR